MLDIAGCSRRRYVDLERLHAAIDGGPYDAVIISSPQAVPHYSGFHNWDIKGLPERPHFVVWPRGGDPAFVVIERRKILFAPGDTYISDVVTYRGEGLDCVRVIVEVMRERGVSEGGRIGIEGRHLAANYLMALQERLPKARFEDAYDFLERPRTVKTAAEIELLARINRMTAEAIDIAFLAAKPGDTEHSIATRMKSELLGMGGEAIYFHTFGAGHRSGVFHGLATDMKVETGMVVKTDLGCTVDGYCSDIARTAVMGKASRWQKSVHARLTEVKHRIVDYIRPGMPASKVALFGRKVYKELDLEYKWHILGHGIGMAVHEMPQIYPEVDEPILPGMVMMIELGYTDFPNESFHMEDPILITDKGAHYLTDASKHEEIWELGL